LLISITQTEEAKSCIAWASIPCHIVLHGMTTWMLVFLVDFLGITVEMTRNYSPTLHTFTRMAVHTHTHTHTHHVSWGLHQPEVIHLKGEYVPNQAEQWTNCSSVLMKSQNSQSSAGPWKNQFLMNQLTAVLLHKLSDIDVSQYLKSIDSISLNTHCMYYFSSTILMI
jgi:hypothetical protein